jgi:AcrR family transcriptional regulator
MTRREAAKRVRRPADRPDELLDAAASLFATKGIDATTVEEITRKAGVSKATFYLYFSSKDEVIAAFARRLVEPLLSETTLVTLHEADEDAFLESVVERMIGYLFDNPHLAALFAREPALADALSEIFAAGLRAGVSAKVFEVDDPYMTALLLSHAVGSSVSHAVQSGEPSRARVIAAARDLVRRALRPN